jgi:nucleoside-diphosphate-sugar epimerase
VNVTVFGATGGVGAHLVDQGLARGHAITALVRDPARLPAREVLWPYRLVIFPLRLTHRPATGRYRAGSRLTYSARSAIPRADVAAFMLDQLANHPTTRTIVEISS